MIGIGHRLLALTPAESRAPDQTASQTASGQDPIARNGPTSRARRALRSWRFQAAGRGFDSRRAHSRKRGGSPRIRRVYVDGGLGASTARDPLGLLGPDENCIADASRGLIRTPVDAVGESP